MDQRAPPVASPSRPSVVMWWAVTVVILVVLDDLTFGPAFWLISRTAGPAWAVAAVYAVYVPAQVFLVHRGTTEAPGRIAAWWLRRLDLDRRFAQVQRNEERLRQEVIGAFPALLLSPVIGGVIPPLVLSRRGHPVPFVRKLSWATATVYATVFALLHGVLPAAV